EQPIAGGGIHDRDGVRLPARCRLTRYHSHGRVSKAGTVTRRAHSMLSFVEIWYRQAPHAPYRPKESRSLRHSLRPARRWSCRLAGRIADRAAPTAVSIAAIGTLWVTDALQEA